MPIVLNGSTNVISGLAVGGLPDGIVDTDMLAADAVTGAKVADDAVGSEHIEQLDSNLQIDRDKYIGTVASGQSTINIGTSGGAQIGFHHVNTNDDELRFYTHTSGVAHTERMRIDSSGNFKFTGSGTQHIDMFNSGDCMDVQTAGTGTQNYGMIVFKNGSGTYCGQVTSNAGNTTTSYLSASDYRLKENEKIITDGITRIKQLKPYRFKWKATGDEVDGFFAHEAQTVVPESVGGTKDEVDSDNKPVYQGIDQSKLVPLLTAALQEAVAKIETLETKVAALEGA